MGSPPSHACSERYLSAQCHAILNSTLEISFLGDSVPCILQGEVLGDVAPSTLAESAFCDDICLSSENENVCTEEVNDSGYHLSKFLHISGPDFMEIGYFCNHGHG